MPVVKPEFAVRQKQSAAMPAIAFGKQTHRLQIRNAGNGRPGTFGFRFPATVHREVNEMLPVRRQITAALINSPTHPLAELERVTLAIPQHRANGLRWPAPNHQPDLCVSREQHMQARGKFASLFWRPARRDGENLWCSYQSIFFCRVSNWYAILAPTSARHCVNRFLHC